MALSWSSYAAEELLGGVDEGSRVVIASLQKQKLGRTDMILLGLDACAYISLQPQSTHAAVAAAWATATALAAVPLYGAEITSLPCPTTGKSYVRCRHEYLDIENI